jgi:hypothetical protein
MMEQMDQKKERPKEKGGPKEGVQKKTVRFFWLPGGHLLFPLGLPFFFGFLRVHFVA